MLRLILGVSVVSLSLLAGCGGGSDGGGSSGATSNGDGRLPPSVPIATISGAAVDGLILQGTVNAYSFSGGAKGALLGTTVTDSKGHYSLNIHTESTPLLLEVTGGHYKEESDGKDVTLQPNQVMTAVTNFTTATPITMAITPWTHVAAGLAIYRSKHGTVVDAAITKANLDVSTALGVDITTVVPLDVTDSTNIAGTMSNALKYGWMSAAISQWTEDQVESTNKDLVHVEPYTSISFAQLMYDDISYEGVLNGVGSAGAIQFASVPLGLNVYRDAIAAAMLKFSGNQNNAVQITAAKALQAASQYRSNIASLWGGAVPVPFANPMVSVSSPTSSTWLQGAASAIAVSASDPTGIYSATLTVDGKQIKVNSSDLSESSASFSFDSTTLTDGPHVVKVEVKNGAGLTSSQTINTSSDNTPPSIDVGLPDPWVLGPTQWFRRPKPGCQFFGRVTDATSGMATVSATFISQTTGSVVAQDFYDFSLSTVKYEPGSIEMFGLNMNFTDGLRFNFGYNRFDFRIAYKDRAGNTYQWNGTQGYDATRSFTDDACYNIVGDDAVRLQ